MGPEKLEQWAAKACHNIDQSTCFRVSNLTPLARLPAT
jgi:hypothetical protein